MAEAASNVIAARSGVQTVASASAHRELLAVAAAWNSGGCVCPLAAGGKPKVGGGEGRLALVLCGGLRPLPGPRAASGPGAFPSTAPGSPHIPLESPNRDVQVGPGLVILSADTAS